MTTALPAWAGADVRARLDLRVWPGADCTFAVSYAERGVDGELVAQSFTGWSARAQLRAYPGAEGQLWHTMSPGDGLTLTSDAATVTVTGRIGYEVTSLDAWRRYRAGVWDLLLIRPAGDAIPLVAGRVFIGQNVTRLT